MEKTIGRNLANVMNVNRTNIGSAERWASVIGGATLLAWPMDRDNWGGRAAAVLGGYLILRGATGHCGAYEAMGMSTAPPRTSAAALEAPYSIKVEDQVEVHRPVEEVYAIWRTLDMFPQFMDHLESVRVIDETRSHWVARGPLGTRVEWDAEIFNEIPNRLLAWRSLEGADIRNAGTVHFKDLGGQRTEVRVLLEYQAPAGVVGATLARLFGEEPSVQVAEDLRSFKRLLESGRATASGTPMRMM